MATVGRVDPLAERAAAVDRIIHADYTNPDYKNYGFIMAGDI